ncbi:Sulfatase-modifying factor enzyme 1 [anaerobic digester metagenome]
MKPGKFHLIALLLAGSALLSAFATGQKKTVKKPEGFVFIPTGTTVIGEKTVTVQAFWMAKTEVTNQDYREYLADLKASGDMEAYNKALPDTTKWREPSGYNEPYVEFYFRHPAYAEYPVVNISHEQADNYCAWLTKKMREAYGDVFNDARLPTREEWVIAARGNNPGAVYPWKGVTLFNEKEHKYACNFRNMGAESVHFNDSTGKMEVWGKYGSCGIAGWINDAADITAPALSYWPNGYGLYNMSGNVAEMVQQSDIVVGGSWKSTGYDVRVESTAPYTGPRTDVGFRPVITYTGSMKK